MLTIKPSKILSKQVMMKRMYQKQLVFVSVLSLVVALVQLRSFKLLSIIHASASDYLNDSNDAPLKSSRGSLGGMEESLKIPINPNSTIANDIVKIWHNPEEGSICVHLKQDARCPYPALIGRLSGPALAMLDWDSQNSESNAGTVHCGEYSNKWLDAEDFFVEILILYCEDFGVGALKRVANLTSWMTAGFKSKCVEDSMRNRITADTGIKIKIPSSTSGKGSYRLGRWVRRAGIPSRPLFTRHQPVQCTDAERGYRPLEPLPRWCEPLTLRDNPFSRTSLWNIKEGDDVFGLPEYEFQWRMNITEEDLIERLRKRLQDKSKNLPKICGVGDSHR